MQLASSSLEIMLEYQDFARRFPLSLSLYKIALATPIIIMLPSPVSLSHSLPTINLTVLLDRY